MVLSNFTYDVVKSVFDQKKYPFYPDPYDLNFWGCRIIGSTPDRFDDFIGVSYVDEKEQPFVKVVMGTTDPGLYWLKNPMMVQGTGILKPGHWRKMWTIGNHKDYRALVQANPVTLIRDNDKDGELDMQGKEDIGMFGVDLHHASYTGTSVNVGKWSAACQVTANIEDFRSLMTLVDRQVLYGHGAFFSYSLFESLDFEGL